MRCCLCQNYLPLIYIDHRVGWGRIGRLEACIRLTAGGGRVLIGPSNEEDAEEEAKEEEEEKELKPGGLKGLKTPRLVLANNFIGLKIDIRGLLSDSSSSSSSSSSSFGIFSFDLIGGNVSQLDLQGPI